MRCRTVLNVAAAGVLAGCGGEDRTETVADSGGAPTAATQPARAASPPAARLKPFAYREMWRQSRKTCRVVPRRVLARSFARSSGDPGLGGDKDPSEWTDNYVALAYAEDVKISPIRLQQAAYDGCLAGLEARRKGRGRDGPK